LYGWKHFKLLPYKTIYQQAYFYFILQQQQQQQQQQPENRV